MKHNKKKGDKSTLLLILLFLAGLSLLLYPTVSNWWNSRFQAQAIQNYTSSVAELDTEKYAALWADVNAYNQALLERDNPFKLSDEMLEQYNELLNVSGSGVMGYVEIPRINSSMPIYHGTDEAVLQVAIGHLEWTSLPVGGESTHSVISGHRGLPSAELLTHIDKMQLGDSFYIHVLDQVLQYRVDNIAVVEPDDASLLQVVEGMDYMTLVTCTPYGINSHRLLVRGVRTGTASVNDGAPVQVHNEIESINLIYIIPAALVLLVVAVALLTWANDRKQHKYHGKRTKPEGKRLAGKDYLYDDPEETTE